MQIESISSSCLAKGLPASEQERLAQILDDYLTAVERGEPITPRELLEQHPEDAEYLRGYLSGIELFHQAARVGRDTDALIAGSGAERGNSKIVGDYRLLREIGRGGMGVVYEAEQVSLRRKVALKVLPSSVAQSDKHLHRFQNEARAAAQIRHPHIVPVYNVGDDNGIHFYAMQLIEGESLATWLENKRGQSEEGKIDAGTTAPQDSVTVIYVRELDTAGNTSRREPIVDPSFLMSAAGVQSHIDKVARWGIQAATGIHAAHEYGVVHRDIKPSNLLIDEQQQLWITDFGLARCRANVGVTETGDVMGTMRYMSPEQALGQSALVDHRTDVYSLGVSLYELATLHHPADGMSDIQLFFERNRFSCKSLQHWNRRIPSDFQTIVLKAMAELPHERYCTAQELADDLQRFANGEAIMASPPGALKRTSNWARRHRGLVWSAAAILLVGLAGSTYNSIAMSYKNREIQQALTTSRESLHEAHVALDQLTGLADQLAAIPGAEGVRYQLIQDTLGHYERFAEKAHDEPEMAVDLALAYRNLGRLNRKLLKGEASLERLSAAREKLHRQASRDPANQFYTQQLAMCLNDIGLVLCDLGREVEATEALTEAEQRLLSIRADFPSQHSATVDLATTRNNLGLALQACGREREATDKFSTAVRILNPLLAESPDDEAVLRSLAASYSNLGIAASRTDRESAVEYFQQAISLQKRLVSLRKVNRIYLDELAKTYNNLGYVLARAQDWTNALACYGDAIRIQENLIKASPFAVSYRRDLAISFNNRGMAQSQIRQLSEAEDSFRRALELQEPLVGGSTSDAKAQSDLGGIYNNLALLLDRSSRYEEAAACYEQAIDYQQRALTLSSGNHRFQELLQNHSTNYEACLKKQEQTKAELTATLKRSSLLIENSDF